MFNSHSVRMAVRPPESFSPIDVETSPVTRHTLHQTPHSSLDILEHEAGEFDLCCSQTDLTAWVLSGSAEVSMDDGRDVVLGPGNALFLPRGLHGRWIVRESLRTAVVFND